MLVRGSMSRWIVKPDGDVTWSEDDWGTANTLEARWKALGLSEDERRRLLPCAIWMKKFPGVVYSDDIMKRLGVLLEKN